MAVQIKQSVTSVLYAAIPLSSCRRRGGTALRPLVDMASETLYTAYTLLKCGAGNAYQELIEERLEKHPENHSALFCREYLTQANILSSNTFFVLNKKSARISIVQHGCTISKAGAL